MSDLVVATEAGLFCPAGGFYIDPWLPVERAIVTHAHADHARPGSQKYLCAADGVHVLRTRLGPDAAMETVAYGQTLSFDGVIVSLHPAGHVLGSAQVRIENRGEVWVASGDYKVAADRTCAGFEPLRCHTFITESTFGLPIYRWPLEAVVWDEINRWWRGNAEAGQCSLVYAYALGKAQRLLSGVDASIGSIYCHGAVERLNADYRTSGIELPPTEYVGDVTDNKMFRTALVVAPPSARGTPWVSRVAFRSRGAARWRSARWRNRRLERRRSDG
ncbi:MAG: ligase-associated DNA damage response exonuclease, partial [Candidatus Saccharimonadales bacterium]